jgi:dTDP-4-amino-4,6-dideoxygalactose transaminase
MKSIPLAKPHITRHERKAAMKVLKSLNLAQGSEVKSFETEFSKFVGDRECVAVNSGTSALHICLMALGIGPDDEVIVPSFTFAATANVVALVGAKPVFVDIDPKTYCMDPNLIRRAINSKTKAIIVVHLYGLPANMVEIQEIAKSHSLLIVEDSAQAHMASISGQPVGTFGDAAAFSFYPTKNMTTGEGGMAVLATTEAARYSRLLRNQGMEKRYQNEIPGFNLRMTDLAASIGRVQLKKLPMFTEKRITNAQMLNEGLDCDFLPFVPENFQHVYHQYTVRIPRERNSFAEKLTLLGIGNDIYYPTQVHMLKTFKSNLELPETAKATNEVLSLPVRPNLTRREIHRVVRIFNSVAREIGTE